MRRWARPGSAAALFCRGPSRIAASASRPRRNPWAIYINGTEQGDYDPEEYRSLISALFQDSMLFPLTLDENLTAAPAEEAN